MIPNHPAFPTGADDTEGMTLRDWFAGQALAGVLTSCAHPKITGPIGLEPTAYATLAYRIADAMLAVRSAA